jgi:hypothetical protein
MPPPRLHRCAEAIHGRASACCKRSLFSNRIPDTVVQPPFTIDNQNIVLNSEDARSFGVDANIPVNSASFTNSPYSSFSLLMWKHAVAFEGKLLAPPGWQGAQAARAAVETSAQAFHKRLNA